APSSPSALSLDPADARAIENGLAPDVVQSNGEELQLVKQDGESPVYENATETQFTYSNGELVAEQSSVESLGVPSSPSALSLNPADSRAIENGLAPNVVQSNGEELKLVNQDGFNPVYENS